MHGRRSGVAERLSQARPDGVLTASDESRQAPAGQPATPTLLESVFPAAQIGHLARAGRNRPNVVYGAHKWWARRPAESVRALLLAAAHGPDQLDDFWRAFRNEDDASYAERRVADPFVGGGTSLVEAQRLGAAVYGIDVDPLAVLITEHELTHLDGAEFEAAAGALLTHLEPLEAQLYPTPADGERPLHYFYVRRVRCPSCDESNLLYRSLVIARDVGRRGGVVRDGRSMVFCPDCLRVHSLDPSRKELHCCARHHRLERGTFTAGRFTCPSCSRTFTHEQLHTALAPRQLIAVESTRSDDKREVRAPTAAELTQEGIDNAELSYRLDALSLPNTPFLDALARHKPGVYGFETFTSLFSSRQLLVFGSAFKWLNGQQISRRVKVALALAISNALASNNLLCGYATDYGRLNQLFSVRDYSLPALSVELNPLHPSAGRGTLRATLRRVAASKRGFVLTDTRDSAIHVTDAASAVWPDTGGFDVIMTDPPYFDYIAYSDLSQFFRVWLAQSGVLAEQSAGKPLYEGTASRETFAERLGLSFRQIAERLKPGGVLVFTYHATSREGWRAAVSAVRAAGLAVSAAFPLWADAKSPGHGHAGNVEYDLVFCCRRGELPAGRSFLLSEWLDMFPRDEVSSADVAAWTLACEELNAAAKVEITR